MIASMTFWKGSHSVRAMKRSSTCAKRTPASFPPVDPHEEARLQGELDEAVAHKGFSEPQVPRPAGVPSAIETLVQAPTKGRIR